MSVALHSYKIDADGKIRVRHTFYAATETEAELLKSQHAGGCKSFGPAVEEGLTIDELVEDVAPPTQADAELGGFDGDISDLDEDDEEADDDEEEEGDDE